MVSPRPSVTTDLRFAIVPEDLAYDERVNDAAIRVYICLARHGSSPDDCYPTHRRIGSLIHKSASSIGRPMKVLEDAGWVLRLPRLNPDTGERMSDGFHVRATPLPAAEIVAWRKKVGAQNYAPPAQKCADQSPQDCAEAPAQKCADKNESPVNETQGNEKEDHLPVVAQVDPEIARAARAALVQVPKGVDRADVDRIVRHLAAAVERHRGIKPSVGPAWYAEVGTLLNSGGKGVDGPPPTPDDVILVIDQTFTKLSHRTGRKGFCWADQIRSGSALRDHWEQLTFELTRKAGPAAGGSAAEIAANLAQLDQLLGDQQ